MSSPQSTEVCREVNHMGTVGLLVNLRVARVSLVSLEATVLQCVKSIEASSSHA